jgi:flavin reductase (DIM6/NTAB) family NADH-FMN oxidoreductase RutF
MNEFIAISPYEMEGNPFQMIDKQWMLITAGDESAANTMTASWGGLGILWRKPVSFAFIRPTRYTYGLLEHEEGFSLCFLGEQYREALAYCGKASGREEPKLARCGLTTAWQDGIPYVAESETVLLCKKIYADDLDPARFLDPGAAHHYPEQDYHRLYIAEVTAVLTK